MLVEFLHGYIYQAVITGQLYNHRVAPPFALADASNGTVAIRVESGCLIAHYPGA